jgi:biopolymer transport protein ExbD
MSAEATEAEAIAELDDELLHARHKRRGNGEAIVGLNLTAMMDIMTILLVYLIKVYADAPESITLSDDMRPPVSSAPENIVPSVTIIISKTAILVDGKPVLKVKDGRIDTTDKANVYQPLSNELTARVDQIKYIADHGGNPFNGDLMIIADGNTPYDLVSSVLYFAGKAQFTTYRLVVRHGGKAAPG